jgi:lactoylglutathione lyase
VGWEALAERLDAVPDARVATLLAAVAAHAPAAALPDPLARAAARRLAAAPSTPIGGLAGELAVSERQDPTGQYGELDTGATTLAFAAYALGDGNFPGGVRRPDPDTPPNVELALVADDLPAAYARALEAGCTSLAEPSHKPQGQDVAYVRDPFGTLVELATPLG